MRKLLVVVLAFMLAFGLSGLGAAEYYDFGGETIHILAQSHHPAWRFVEGDWPGANRYGTAYGLHEEAEALFNCKIEFHVMGWTEQPQVLMSRLLSGDSENDLWVMINRRYAELMPQGAFLPLNEYLSEDYFAELPGVARGVADYMTFRGQRYAFGAIGAGLASLAVVVYDKQWFETWGLPDPQDLYEDGEWTWEAMFDIARQAGGDTTGDGNIDRWGINGMGRISPLMAFLHTNGGASLYQEVDDRMMFTGTDPNFIEGLNAVRELIDEGVANPDGNLSHDTKFLDGLVTGDVVMTVTPLGRLDSMDPTYRYAIVPLPLGPADNEHRNPAVWIDTALVLPVNSRHPEGMIELTHFLYSVDDYYMVVEELVQGYARDRRTAGHLWEMHDNWGPWVWNSIPAIMPAQNGVAAVLAGEKTAAVAMGEVAAAVQANLDEMFDF